MTDYQLQQYISKNLKWVIVDNGISLSKLAMLTGISQSLLIHYTKGDCIPSLSNIAKICFALDIDIDELIDVDIVNRLSNM